MTASFFRGCGKQEVAEDTTAKAASVEEQAEETAAEETEEVVAEEETAEETTQEEADADSVTITDDAGQVHFTFVDWEKKNEDGNWESIGASSDKPLADGDYRFKVIMELTEDLKHNTALDISTKLAVNDNEWVFYEVSGYTGSAISAITFYSEENNIDKDVPYKRGRGIPDDGNIKRGRWFDRYGATYYITADGKYLHGLHRVEGHIYFFNKSGAIKKNVVLTLDGKKYYFNKLGRMHFGLKKLNGATYYFDNSKGYMKFEFQTLSDVTGSPELFYFRPGTGAMVKEQFMEIGGYKYYFKKNGAAQKEWLEKWGTKYYFDEKCRMLFGFQEIKGATYYFRPETGGMVKDSFETINGLCYYFKPNGHMAKDEIVIKWGVRYFFDNAGHLTKTERVK